MKSAGIHWQASCAKGDKRVQTGKPQMIRFEPKATVYSEAMPDIQQVLPWRSLDQAQKEASQQQLPVLAVVVAPWSTGAHLLYRELMVPETQQIIASGFVPVLVNPAESPALTAAIAAIAQHQHGNPALPLLAVLTFDGNPALAWAFVSPEHRANGEPSTPAVLKAIGEQWSTDAAGFESEWESASKSLLLELPERDEVAGGYVEQTKQLHPYQLASTESNDPWLQRTLREMWIYGVRDQLEASFHPATRDFTWVVPYFEKIIPQNAAMALAFARCAQLSNDRELRSRAQDLVRFCLNALLQDTDVISAESSYYTWLSHEAYDAVGRQNLQAVSLLYGIQPSAHRQVLSQSRTINQIREISFDSEEDLNKRILAGNAEMLMFRRTRPAPRPITMDDLIWRTTTFRYLLLAMDALESSERSLLTSAFVTWLEGKQVPESVDITIDCDFRDQVSLLAAMLLAKSRTDHAVMDSLLPQVLTNVRDGIEHWSGVAHYQALWLHRHEYLPSVASTLEAIRTLLPNDEQLPVL